MKKLIASVLAAASVLSLSATAFAADATKSVTKTGDVSYDVAVTAPKIVLDLVMPAKMVAALNPYGAEIKLDEGTNAVTNGIASVAYKIENKTTDYGVFFDATAITTITTTDKAPERGKNAWDVKGGSTTAGTKSAVLNLASAKDVAGIKTAAGALKGSSAAATKTNNYGVLVLDSSVEANKEAGTVAGQTDLDQFLFVGAAAEAYIAFVGDLAQSSSDSKVVWNEDDAINVNLVLKVTAGPKTYTN